MTRDGQRTTSYLRAGHASADVVLALTGEEHTEPATTLRLYCRKMIPSADGRGSDLDRIIEVPWHQTIERRLVGTVQRCDVRIDVPGGAVTLPVKQVLQASWYSGSDDPRQALRVPLLDRLQASEDDVAIPVMPAEASGRIECRMTFCIRHGRASRAGAARRQPTAGLREPVWIDVATR